MRHASVHVRTTPDAMTDLKLGRLPGGIDYWAERNGLSAQLQAPDHPIPTRIPDARVWT